LGLLRRLSSEVQISQPRMRLNRWPRAKRLKMGLKKICKWRE
jgi:hypothetical protein